MFGLFIYAIVCLIISGVLITVRTMLTKVQNLTEGSNVVRLFLAFVAVTALPYIWVEVQTRLHADTFEDAVFELAEMNDFEGNLDYYKVQYLWGGRAKVILVSEGQDSWGGTWRNIYSARFNADGLYWVLAQLEPVNTVEGDSSGFTLPPYW